MSKIDPDAFKPRLREYLQRKGIQIKTDERPNRISCPSPNHADANPTACIYDDSNIIYCPICTESWDVFEVAGLLIGVYDFPAKRDEVLHTLGAEISADSIPYQPKTKTKPEPKPSKMVPLSMEDAQKFYSKNRLTEIAKKDADKKGWGTELIAAWPYKNAAGEIEVVDVRYHGGEREKTVISFFYDGRDLKWAGTPVVISNRDKMANNLEIAILVVEGAKSTDGSKIGVKGAESIPGFLPTTWNGGTGKIHLADWSSLKGRIVYFYPDDDQKKYPDNARDFPGQLKPPQEQPGIKAALELWSIGQKIGFEVIICQPYDKARELKGDGADIIEALQILSPAAMAEYILSGPKIDPTQFKKSKPASSSQPKLDSPRAANKPPAPPSIPNIPPDPGKIPFRILGLADNGRAYFIDRAGHLQIFSLASLTKTQLMILAPKDWWQREFSNREGVSWDDAIDFIIEIAGQTDFNPDNIRGRGAWRESDGRICYHDGYATIGDPDKSRLYVKKTYRPIGIGAPETPIEIRRKIFDLACEMSFESKVDVLRLLSWSILAPFGGALPWRNAIMITGPSSSGKTAINDLLVKPLASPKMYSGATTTEAGIRQDSPNDSEPVAIEESETDTVNKKKNREAQFTLMRESTSEDSPVGAKGTIDGRGMQYRLRKMFCFIAISPDIDSWADENRMNLVNIREPTHTPEQWATLKKSMETTLTELIAASIRSTTWVKLPAIIEMARWLTAFVHTLSGKKTRQAFSEAMLLAAYVIIWQGHDSITDDQAIEMIQKFYSGQEPEEKRDEADEMLTRLLDESVFVQSEKSRGGTKMQLREILEIITTGHADSEDDFAVNGKRPCTRGEVLTLKKVAYQFGFAVYSGHYAVAFNHHEIKRILQRGNGYHKVLQRHKACIEKRRNVAFGTGSGGRNCVIIAQDLVPF